jgi:hypothetical protein
MRARSCAQNDPRERREMWELWIVVESTRCPSPWHTRSRHGWIAISADPQVLYRDAPHFQTLYYCC